MSDEQARAFAISDDHERQTLVFENGGKTASARWIRAQLTTGEIRASDKRAIFIGVEAYEAAGGAPSVSRISGHPRLQGKEAKRAAGTAGVLPRRSAAAQREGSKPTGEDQLA